MTKFKSALLATMIIAAPLVASPAFASHYEILDGGVWKATGVSAVISGPTIATLAGLVAPCTARFTFSLSATGAATVSVASFVPGAICEGIRANNMPGSTPPGPGWLITAPTIIAGSTSVGLNTSGISFSFPYPPGTCTGNAAGILTNANPNDGGNNVFTFTAPLTSPCTNVKSNPSLTSNKPIRYVAVP